MNALEYELDLESDFEDSEDMPPGWVASGCYDRQLWPEPGRFSRLLRTGHNLFLPKYRTSPSNIWSLAREVRTKMIDSRKSERGLPSVLQVIEAIREFNPHLKSKMFLPRFASDRCTPGKGHYGLIYIPFKF